jgi:hypothetical protein
MIISAALMLLCSTLAAAQSLPDSAAPTVIIPGPEPFSLDAYSAVQLIAMLEREHLVEVRDGAGRPNIVVVRTVYAIPSGVMPDYPAGARLRYDIVLNGSPVDWDHTFIVYGEELVNLRALFTYRNQYPPAGLMLRIPTP